MWHCSNLQYCYFLVFGLLIWRNDTECFSFVIIRTPIIDENNNIFFQRSFIVTSTRASLVPTLCRKGSMSKTFSPWITARDHSSLSVDAVFLRCLRNWETDSLSSVMSALLEESAVMNSMERTSVVSGLSSGSWDSIDFTTGNSNWKWEKTRGQWPYRSAVPRAMNDNPMML